MLKIQMRCTRLPYNSRRLATFGQSATTANARTEARQISQPASLPVSKARDNIPSLPTTVVSPAWKTTSTHLSTTLPPPAPRPAAQAKRPAQNKIPAVTCAATRHSKTLLPYGSTSPPPTRALSPAPSLSQAARALSAPRTNGSATSPRNICV